MKLRSLLFVPADSERKLARARDAGADALILDLEDSVAPPNRPAARALAAAYLADRPGPTWVRINPLDSSDALADLAAIVCAAPDGIMLPKCLPAHVERLHAMLDALEARDGLPAGAIRIIPVATETPAAVLALGEYATRALPRLAALTWGAEDLAAELGASTNRMPSGVLDVPYQAVRVQALLAARAAGVEPVDTLHADFRDTDGLRADTERAARQGFTGRLAIHPDQVPPINAAFTPTEAELAHARAVVAAFADGAGVASLDGKMLDAPHLRAAERVLAREL